MKSGDRWGCLNEAFRLILISLLAVSAGYLVRLPIEIRMGAGVTAALTTRDFHDGEGDFRWTRERSSLIFPDPGPGLEVRVEALVSGFRPRGSTPPLVVIEAGEESLRARPGRGETIILKTTTPRGWWSSDLEVLFRSETFSPGEMDQRSLGVRVHRVRLVPEGSVLGFGRAPLGQLVVTSLILLLFFALLTRHGLAPRQARWVGTACALAWGGGFTLARSQTALASTPLLVAASLAFGVDIAFPSLAGTFSETLRETLLRLGRGLKLLARWPSVALAAAGCLGVTGAYLARPTLEIDLGSGRETTLVHQFSGFDQERGVKFRRALRGAWIDLRDFGGASTWNMEITASLVERSQGLVLARTGAHELETILGPEWSTHRLEARAPLGWRSGLAVELPSASEAIELRVDRLHLERGRCLPSIRIMAYVIGAALLFVVGSGACGLGGISRWIMGGVILAAEISALVVDPLLAVPFVPTFFSVVVGAALMTALASGFLHMASRRRLTPSLPPVAGVAAMVGFSVWLSVTLFPLYVGGHFVFHSSIAQEIWQGKFLTYYLPYPGSMLSRQTQWGSIIVPHSCLYHTLMAPLAALPRVWFYGLEKTALALMLAFMAIISSLLAAKVRCSSAGVFAGVIFVSLAPTVQLLGLGHVMTLFGCWAATLALGVIILRFDNLQERSTWWWATALLTLCFLSYTASLLLTAVSLAVAIAFLARRAGEKARVLAWAMLAASFTAFMLYYVNWTLPFLRESVPSILSGVGSQSSDFSLWSRLAAIPRKLTYTYGHPLLPLAGLAGLALARRSPQRTLLACWASMLVLFSGFDLFFNFLLKHHYFVMPPVTVGAGLAAAWLFGKGRWGKAAVVVLVAYVMGVGARAALGVAFGQS